VAEEAVPRLTSDLDCWEIRFKTGELVTLRAHAVREEDEDWVFVALMEGSPAFEYELARFPTAVVDEVEGGWPAPRS